MVKCPLCKTECPENSNFCLHCGATLNSRSAFQKQSNDEIDPTISNETMTRALKRLMPTSYVEKLLASKGKMDGERRIVTILFSDVKGSTSLGEKLDPEEVLEVMNGAFNVLIEPITRYEGTLARLMGDAILAFFGAPIAHEDDPYRACRAALDILEGAKAFSKKLEHEKGIAGFNVRVGINTGLVVVAEVGTDLRVEYTAMGDAVNIAARMESAAEPGTILITEATKKLVLNQFELLTVGPIQVKGKSDLITTYRILDLKKNLNTLQTVTAFHSPLIGREKELNKLQEVLGRLHQGTGGIISLVGDGGVGKSRLVAEIRNQKLKELKWAEGRALTYTTNNSYWMVRSLLKNFLGFHQESSDISLLQRLHKTVEANFGDKIEEVYPYIEYFLNPSGEKRKLKGFELNDLRAIRGQFHYATKEFLKKESLQQPVVMVWEDLQWCDLPSFELLTELLPVVREVPILLLMQYRMDENDKKVWNFHHNNLKEHDDIHEVISLNPLGEDESILLIKNLLGDRNIAPEVQNKVIEKTEGNPSFLEEIIHSIIDGDDPSREGHSSEAINFNGEIELPNLLRSVIMSRVDHLEQIDKNTLQTAAVIGRVFQKNLLAGIMKNSLADSEFEKSLKELQIREFILRHLPANNLSKSSNLQKEYIFKQEIAQNVIYNSLLLSHRQILHKQIGEEIEALNPNNREEHADSLAIHFEKGKVFNKAIYYNRVAADRAKDFFANDNAIFFYLKALKLSEETEIDAADLAEIYESIADVYSLTAQYSKAIDNFKLSLNYYKGSSNQAKVHYKCGQTFERWGQYKQALESYNVGLGLINKEKEKVLSSQIYAGMGMVYYRQENLTEAERFNLQALTTLSAIGSEQDIADVYNNLGIVYCKLGDLEKSLDFHERCLKIREHIGNSSGLAASNNNLGYLYQLRNELDKAVEYYNKSLEYCGKTGNLHGLARTYDNLSHIYISQGKDELAMDYNLKAIAILGKIAKEGSQINSDVWLQSGVW